MTDVTVSKDTLTMADDEIVRMSDLKRAIADIRQEPSPELSGCDWCSAWTVHHSTRAAAWQVAFGWRLGLFRRYAVLNQAANPHLTDFIALDREHDEGMRLIRERLQS